MKSISLGKSDLKVPPIAIGCMRIEYCTPAEAEKVVKTALDLGANFFDHADIYGDGVCEEKFAQAVGMNATVREKLIIQSKTGIRKGIGYDFSKEHILTSVDGILKRLKTDYIDVLLLHRPDALVEPEEVAEAFDFLKSSGKVHHFGVSNQNPNQIKLLQKYLHVPIVANQLQFGIAHATMVSQGLHVNMGDDTAIARDGYILDFCRLEEITIQPWSPFQYGFFKGVFLGSDEYPELNVVIDRIAKQYSVSNTTIALAWILRHPAKMQAVIGSMNPERIKECVKAADITLTREEWYEIYFAAGNDLP